MRPARHNTRRDPRFLVLLVALSDVDRYPAIANHCPCCFGVDNLKGSNRAPRQIGHRISLVLPGQGATICVFTPTNRGRRKGNKPPTSQRSALPRPASLTFRSLPYPEDVLEMDNFTVMGKSNKNNIITAGFR
jgi:hypothetical protein